MCSMIWSIDFFRRTAADFRPGAAAQALGQGGAQLDASLGERHVQRLGVGIRRNELHAFKLSRNHVVDGIAAGATDAEDDDAGFQLPRGRHAQIDTHVLLQGYKLL
jgi:hypothetical protein